MELKESICFEAENSMTYISMILDLDVA